MNKLLLDDSYYWKHRTTSSDRTWLTFRDYDLFKDAKTILDWGCSSGLTTIEIAQNSFAKVSGIDLILDENMPLIDDELKQRLEFISGDGYFYFQEKGITFDFVLANNNIAYIINDSKNPQQIISYLEPLVAEKGKLAISASIPRQRFYFILKKEKSKLLGEDFYPKPPKNQPLNPPFVIKFLINNYFCAEKEKNKWIFEH